MKISPIIDGVVGQADQPNGTGATLSAKQRAVAALQGQPAVPAGAQEMSQSEPLRQQAPSIRRVTVQTNASPERYQPAVGNNLDSIQSETNDVVEVTQPLSPQAAAIAKQRRALQVKERDLAQRERALKASNTDSVASSPPSPGIDLARLKAEPLSVLREAGVTYSELTQAILADSPNKEVLELKDQIKALKTSVDEQFTTRELQAKQQVLAEMTRDATSLAAQGETFELIRETRSVPKVMSLIEQTFDKTGEVLMVEEAMQLIEAELLKDSMKLASTAKLRAQLQPQQQLQQRPQMTTLTNRSGSSAPMSAKQRAIAAFHGTLKK